ncbi:Nif3-like dinuclear metal center hexameric protein [Peptoniphilus indolicus]|uniref:GTP cyclohydrolase 1 type 2 homolog n=2 Tax=Peptoniphilus indolicus TaxID=33030 RepID=G4D4K5_9FIRM|nr:Nif3-like dinuclear metal center hexameric protein [Peptoniphilus indolicus]EGY79552.1 hypothetical protein HMPREF9129_1335 [Peptoniphilus indolicus ATCC 29427]SUB76022.1 metal-binding protein [Peptoniphilus indolicus]
MSYRAVDIVEYIEKLADPKYQESWDNSGWQIKSDVDVNKVLICMDLTLERIEYALKNEFQLIITHHPMFFSGIKSIQDDYKSKMIKKLVMNNICVYSAHTSFDVSNSGVNKVLFDFLMLEEPKDLIITDSGKGLGLIGVNKNFKSINELLKFLESNLLVDSYKVYGRSIKDINKIALIGGSGASEIQSAIDNGADVYLTSDVKHHDAQIAYENDLILIDISHNDSEKLALKWMSEYIKEKFDIEIETMLDNAFTLKLD